MVGMGFRARRSTFGGRAEGCTVRLIREEEEEDEKKEEGGGRGRRGGGEGGGEGKGGEREYDFFPYFLSSLSCSPQQTL